MKEGCPSNEELREWIEANVPRTESVRISEHVETCPNCAARVDELAGWAPVNNNHLLALTPASTTNVLAAELPTFPGYEIENCTGAEESWRFYEARQTTTGRHVSLIALAPNPASPERIAARMPAQVARVTQLMHPSLIKIVDVGQASGRFYVAEERIEGRLLSEHCKSTPQAIDWSVEIVAALASALHEAHVHGFVHCELEPSQIWITSPDGAPKVRPVQFQHFVTDDASAYEPAQQEDAPSYWPKRGIFLGQPGYKAPEQSLAQVEHFGPAIDVYALGAILYELLTGHRPHEGTDARDVVQKSVTEAPCPPRRFRPGLPHALETVCLRCLALRAEDRYPTAQALADELRSFQRAPDRFVPSTKAKKRLQRQKRSGRSRSLAAFAILTLAPAVLGAFLVSSEPKPADPLIESQALAASAGMRAARLIGECERLVQTNHPTDRERAAQLLSTVRNEILPIQERLARLRNKPEPFLECASCYQRIAELASNVNRPRAAEKCVAKAESLLRHISLDEQGPDALQESVARAWLQLGLAQIALEPKDAAFGSIDRAREIFQMLAKKGTMRDVCDVGQIQCDRAAGTYWRKFGDEHQARIMLSREQEAIATLEERKASESACWLRAGNALRRGTFELEQGNTADALPFLRESLELCDAMIERGSRVAEARRRSANALHALGKVHQKRRELNQAEECFRAALRRFDKVRVNWRARIALVQERTSATQDLGELLLSSAGAEQLGEENNRLRMAAKAFSDAQVLCEQLLAAQPGITGHRITMGLIYVRLGDVSNGLGKDRETMQWLERARPILRPIYKQDPKNKVITYAYYRLLQSYAGLSEKLGNLEQAIGAWTEILELSNGKNNHQRAKRAELIARNGDHVRAAQEAGEIQMRAKHDAFRWLAARVYAHCVHAVHQDGKLDGSAKKQSEAKYAGLAFQILDEIRKRGYFDSNKRHASELEKAPWNALVQFSEHQELLDRILPTNRSGIRAVRPR